MLVAMVVTSISSMVIQNCLFNNVCKKELKTNDHIYRFNIIIYAICIVLFGLGLLKGNISVYTVVIGLLFGVVTALGNLYKMLALSSGAMHITLLITTSSMIIPAMSGIFFGESLSITKFALIIMLVGFIYLSLGKGENGKKDRKWILFCLLAFLFQGSIGVLQKIHQSSAYKGETDGFLFVAFICSLVYSFFRTKKSLVEAKLGNKNYIFAAICGICTYSMNIINLKLSGILPSQLFFPLVNGSAIILSSLASVIIFKESISRVQLIGLCGGIVTLIGICLV